MNITKEQYLKALKVVWKEYDREVLQTYVDLDGCKASTHQIAQILNMSSLGEVNLKFGGLGKRIAEYHNISFSPENNGRPKWYRILAEGEMENGSFKWKLRPAFVEALNEFGITGNEVKLPEEFNDDLKEYIEGARRQITVNAYERNAKARELCIKEHESYCHVCEFDFEKIYGELGKGYIHVHHIEPLAAKTEFYQVDPLKDLIPVCPNCHAMLHKKNPPYSVMELKQLMK